MAAEIYQAQVIRNFFDTITGPDRNLTRIYMCVISLAKLRMEPPEKLKELMDQVRKSREKKELSVDILDYVCNVAMELEISQVQTGQTTSTGVAYSFGPIAVGTSGSSPVFGTSITYLCREPQSTVLNESVVEMASSDNDCGALFCVRVAPAAEYGTCAAQGGGG